jgi:hypothetical protein
MGRGCEGLPYRLKGNKVVGVSVVEGYEEENNGEVEEAEGRGVDDVDLLEESDPDMGIESDMGRIRDSSW